MFIVNELCSKNGHVAQASQKALQETDGASVLTAPCHQGKNELEHTTVKCVCDHQTGASNLTKMIHKKD